MKRILFWIGVLILWWPARIGAQEIVLGTSAAFSGPSKGLGIELYRGATAYFEQVNSHGGVHGHKIAIKTYDDGYNPTPAIENTIQLIEKDNVFLLFNYVGTPTVTRCLPLLKHNQDRSVYLFFPFTGAQPQRQPPYGEFVFNLRASYYQETGGLVDHFVEIGRKRIAVFYQIDAYGRNGWEGVRSALAQHGLKMAGEATYRRGTTYQDSMSTQVEILRKTEADAVICIGSYAACGAFVRDTRDAGWDVPIANVSFVGSESMLALLNETGRTTGRDYTVNLINSQVVPSYHDLELPAVREYRALMDRHNPQPPRDVQNRQFQESAEYKPLSYSFVSLEGFLNAKLLVAILEKMGPPFQRHRLKSVAESLRDLDLGAGAQFSFGDGRHQASDRVYYTVVKNGQFESLLDWKRWQR
ncbi:MAG TPA: ABC transporter substrate-binding protein [Gemmataceae bacterium]|nr:ABC transporter substrate-binding protein [Gemmataceae bacterium]